MEMRGDKCEEQHYIRVQLEIGVHVLATVVLPRIQVFAHVLPVQPTAHVCHLINVRVIRCHLIVDILLVQRLYHVPIELIQLVFDLDLTPLAHVNVFVVGAINAFMYFLEARLTHLYGLHKGKMLFMTRLQHKRDEIKSLEHTTTTRSKEE